MVSYSGSLTRQWLCAPYCREAVYLVYTWWTPCPHVIECDVWAWQPQLLVVWATRFLHVYGRVYTGHRCTHAVFFLHPNKRDYAVLPPLPSLPLPLSHHHYHKYQAPVNMCSEKPKQARWVDPHSGAHVVFIARPSSNNLASDTYPFGGLQLHYMYM